MCPMLCIQHLKDPEKEGGDQAKKKEDEKDKEEKYDEGKKKEDEKDKEEKYDEKKPKKRKKKDEKDTRQNSKWKNISWYFTIFPQK